jgi:hypothetical protein
MGPVVYRAAARLITKSFLLVIHTNKVYIILFGSSNSLTVRQMGKAFTVYKSEVVPQACLQLFSFLDTKMTL